jgi:UDP-glucose 4-epimerase
VSRKVAKTLSKIFFITGATGFIGQRLVARLKTQGARINVLSRSQHPKYKTVVCDLQSEVVPDEALEGVDTVFHLAGLAHDLSDASELEGVYRKINVDATIRLAVLSVRAGVKRFVFVSSVKAGGRIYDLDEVNGTSERIYGDTKREAELQLLEITRQSSMHVAIVRPALVYGPGAKGNLQLMCSGIEKGWFPPLPLTGNRRSMIHVDDLVQALLLVAEDERANGEIFIATDGVPHSSREIYEAICQAVGKTIPKWSVPKFVFDWISKFSPQIRYKVDKLLGEEYYSSTKLEGLGFQTERTLKDWNLC